MSNYLVLVHHARLQRRIDDWIVRNGAEHERRSFALGRRHRLLIVSKDVDACIRGDRFFRGTASAPEHDAVAFGVDGWLELASARALDPAATGGEFVAVDWTGGRVRIARDVFSSVPLLETSGPGFHAASDSMLVLHDLRAHLGVRSTRDDAVLLGRAITSGLGGQQLSSSTQVEQIAFVPAGRTLALDVGLGVRRRLLGDAVGTRVLDAPDHDGSTLRLAAARIARSVAATSTLDGWAARLSLSGGFDSRIVLAAAMRSHVLERVHVSSRNETPAHAADHAVATQLGERFGFTLHAPDDSTGSEPVAPPLATWASSTLGTYDRMAPASARRPPARSIGLSGLGSALLKGGWRWQTLDELTAPMTASERVIDAFRQQFNAGLRDIGASSGWQDASELHYLGYRNGLHSAQGVATSMTGLRPLQQLSLAAVGHTRTDGARDVRRDRARATFRGDDAAIADLLILLHPELAAHPYDDPRRDLGADLVAERVAALGGPLGDDELGAAVAYGHPDDVPSGPSELGLRIAQRRGFDGDATPDRLLDIAEGAIDLLDGAVREEHALMLRRAEWLMRTKRLAPEHSGSHIAKLLTVAALA